MKLILLDSNSLVNRAYYAMPSLRTADGVCTGGVYGFMAMLAKLIDEEKPTHIACAFDVHAPTFRHKQYAEYKAGRRPMPEELREQIPLLKELLTAMNIPIVELAGYEADDILGTLSSEADMPVVVVSGDKDVLQLVSDNVTVLHTKRGISDVIAYTPERLKEDGLEPWQVPELKGLMGDSSDNIKGVAGVGEKTARDLIAQYGSLDGLYERLDEVKGKLQDKLREGKEDAYFSRDLATICRTVPLDVKVADCKVDLTFPAEAEALMRKLEFKKLIDRFAFQEGAAPAVELKAETVAIDNTVDMDKALALARNTKRFALAMVEGKWHFAVDKAREYVVEYGEDLFATMDTDAVMRALSKVLTDDGVAKVTFDGKATYYAFAEYCGPFPTEDASLASYVLDANRTWAKLEDMLSYYGYSAEIAAVSLLAVFDKINAKLEEEGVLKVYREIELPLMPILYDMERTGFRVDLDVLNALGDKFTAEINQITKDIYDYAGEEFNLNSPKQLATVLFDKLGLPTDKKRSTAQDKLEHLALLHPVVPYILRYRKISKLQSTYVSGLLPLLDANHRLHTIFKQALTATGRLSSTEPNLQNIPVRTKEGKQIRTAFVASEGNKLVVADYSQIELRLMAHFSEDANMLKAYREGQDIHAATAAKVYGVPIAEVTPEMRSSCKAVNFGIIYGISDFGLSENIGVSVKEAKRFIEKYFELYPGVDKFMHDVVEVAKKQGYVTTLSGRKRSIPELSSAVYNVRAFGERVAINTPMQGTASDIIKIAMIKVYHRLLKEGLKAKMILQVHDELVIDTPEAEVEKVASILKEEMESVYTLKVPLVASVGVGDNWVDAK